MQIIKMRMGGEEKKISFYGKSEGGKKNHYLCFFGSLNVFLSLSYLQYLKVLIRNKARWCRLQKALLGELHFQGCQSTKRSGDLVCNKSYAWPNQRQGTCPLCKDQAGLGWLSRSSSRDGSDQGVFGYFAWG